MISDPIFYLCAIPSVLLFGMSKGGLGGGPAMLSVPLMALAISPLQAAAILLPLLLIMDAVAVWSFRGKWDKQQVNLLLPGALLGIVIGTLTFNYVPESGIKVMIGAISLGFSLNYYIKRYRARLKRQAEIPPAETNVAKASFWGLVSGYTSFVIHSGGPCVSVYLLPLRLQKETLVATFALFFAAVNVAKLFPYLWLGQLNTSNLIASAVLVPFAPMGVRLGYSLMQRSSQAFIYEISYFFLVAVGIKLGWEGIAELLGA